ncbi:MAG: hypothetical protein MZV63_19605 [Marinilabiliales bacterium]|nr:hypothetical protein [Marinilabiliales bacterium]
MTSPVRASSWRNPPFLWERPLVGPKPARAKADGRDPFRVRGSHKSRASSLPECLRLPRLTGRGASAFAEFCLRRNHTRGSFPAKRPLPSGRHCDEIPPPKLAPSGRRGVPAPRAGRRWLCHPPARIGLRHHLRCVCGEHEPPDAAQPRPPRPGASRLLHGDRRGAPRPLADGRNRGERFLQPQRGHIGRCSREQHREQRSLRQPLAERVDQRQPDVHFHPDQQRGGRAAVAFTGVDRRLQHALPAGLAGRPVAARARRTRGGDLRRWARARGAGELPHPRFARVVRPLPAHVRGRAGVAARRGTEARRR